jgi:transcriptional regulator with XRE-family HTH domain
LTYPHSRGQNEGRFADNVGMAKRPISQILAGNLAPFLKERGAQQRLADRTGLSPGSVSEIVRGLVSPQLDTLERIADYLGVMVWELVLDSEEAKVRAWSKIMSQSKPEDFLSAANQPLPGQVHEMRPRKGVAARARKKKTPQGNENPQP